MQWVLGTTLNVRTIAAGCAVITVATITAVMWSHPLHISLPQYSFSFGSSETAVDGSTISVTRAEAVNASMVVSSIDDVHSQADLVAYANSLMQADPNITQIDIGSKSVSMTYETVNRVLNVRTVSDETSATVAEDGTVAIAGSWYRPFFTSVANASSPNLGFSDITLVHDGEGLSPRTEARILARLQGRFQIGALK